MIRRGWEVVYFDNTVVNESQLDWKAVKKNQDSYINFTL